MQIFIWDNFNNWPITVNMTMIGQLSGFGKNMGKGRGTRKIEIVYANIVAGMASQGFFIFPAYIIFWQK